MIIRRWKKPKKTETEGRLEGQDICTKTFRQLEKKWAEGKERKDVPNKNQIDRNLSAGGGGRSRTFSCCMGEYQSPAS